LRSNLSPPPFFHWLLYHLGASLFWSFILDFSSPYLSECASIVRIQKGFQRDRFFWTNELQIKFLILDFHWFLKLPSVFFFSFCEYEINKWCTNAFGGCFGFRLHGGHLERTTFELKGHSEKLFWLHFFPKSSIFFPFLQNETSSGNNMIFRFF
jgi:hypothetical protein